VTEAELVVRIEALTDERRVRWQQGLPAGPITDQINAAWDELRRMRAVQQHGTTESIVQRARIERELEKLMAEATT
jgi:hypothetical protein